MTSCSAGLGGGVGGVGGDGDDGGEGGPCSTFGERSSASNGSSGSDTHSAENTCSIHSEFQMCVERRNSDNHMHTHQC